MLKGFTQHGNDTEFRVLIMGNVRKETVFYFHLYYVTILKKNSGHKNPDISLLYALEMKPTSEVKV